MKFKNWTISKKLWALSGCLLFCLALEGGFSVWSTKSLIQQSQSLANIQMPLAQNMVLLDMMHDNFLANTYRAIVIGSSKDFKSVPGLKADIEDASKNVQNYITKIDALPTPENIDKQIEAVKPKFNQYMQISGQVVELAVMGKVETALLKMPELLKQFEVLEKELEHLGSEIEAYTQKFQKDGETFSERMNIISTGALVLTLLLCFAISGWIIRDLKGTLQFLISKLGTQSEVLSSSANGLQVTAKELEDSTNQQASAVQETAASVDEITAMVKKTDENSRQLEQSSRESQDSVHKGQTSVSEMLSSISAISESNSRIVNQIEESNQKITEIVKVISEIGNKTKVINDIVFQTKLLSFNASVEAARAGEHGKGFAVVAEEVGNLAQMSGNAAKEISDMLDSSIQKVESIVNESKRKVESLIQEGKQKVQKGTSVAEECGGALDEIVKQTADVGSMTTEITTAIREQNQGIEEISKALNLLNQSTTKNAGVSRNTSSIADTLQENASDLNTVVQRLHHMTFGASSKGVGFQSSERNDLSPPRNVIPIAPLREKRSSAGQWQEASSVAYKRAAGDPIPSKDDPRFEDV